METKTAQKAFDLMSMMKDCERLISQIADSKYVTLQSGARHEILVFPINNVADVLTDSSEEEKMKQFMCDVAQGFRESAIKNLVSKIELYQSQIEKL